MFDQENYDDSDQNLYADEKLDFTENVSFHLHLLTGMHPVSCWIITDNAHSKVSEGFTRNARPGDIAKEIYFTLHS